MVARLRTKLLIRNGSGKSAHLGGQVEESNEGIDSGCKIGQLLYPFQKTFHAQVGGFGIEVEDG